MEDLQVDTLLEEELESLYRSKSCLSIQENLKIGNESAERVRSSAPLRCLKSGNGDGPNLSFAFPNWNFSSENKKDSGSVIETKGFNSITSMSKDVQKCKNCREYNPRRVYFSNLPDEIISKILKLLCVADVLCVRSVNKSLYNVASSDDLWLNLIIQNNVTKSIPPSNASRFLWFKNNYLAYSLSLRFGFLRKGHEALRISFDDWWNSASTNSPTISSEKIKKVFSKLTSANWTLLYEALESAFIDRSERISEDIKTKILGSFHEEELSGRIDETFGFSRSEMEKGKEIWVEVLKTWKIYKVWLKLIASYAPKLELEVMLERSRAFHGSNTPTIYEKGLICFRQYVTLSFVLQRFLQAGLVSLALSELKDENTPQELEILKKIRNLYQEIDVTDDTTSPPKSFSQANFRRSFGVFVEKQNFEKQWRKGRLPLDQFFPEEF